MWQGIGYIIPINKKYPGGGAPPASNFVELEPNNFLVELEASTDLVELE